MKNFARFFENHENLILNLVNFSFEIRFCFLAHISRSKFGKKVVISDNCFNFFIKIWKSFLSDLLRKYFSIKVKTPQPNRTFCSTVILQSFMPICRQVVTFLQEPLGPHRRFHFRFIYQLGWISLQRMLNKKLFF